MFSHPPASSSTVAAVDLGSNSFHMIVAKVDDGHFQVVDKLREMVRLGAGLNKDKGLTPESQSRALECLKRFGQRLKALPPGSVRAVGTNTLRQVREAQPFLKAAESALGHPIEIIGGREEARLIYIGVAHGLATGEARRLVVDIGGGSTELIVGDGFVPKLMESLHMGCVSMSRNHFPDGRITRKAMRKAELAGALEMRPIKSLFRESDWQLAIGCSGTVRAIRDAILGAGWAPGREEITLHALERLRDTLVDIGHVNDIALAGVSMERQPVFAGGVAVLSSVFHALEIDQMQISDMALREGLLYGMLGRVHEEDVRESTVRAICRRYEVDFNQAGRVETTARAFFAQILGNWGMQGGDYAETLGWAARLHEIGLTVSHTQYHKHGGYLIANSDMAGFTREEQSILAALVRGHRQKFPVRFFQTLPTYLQQPAIRLCVLLRLAVLLHRSRSPNTRVDALLDANENSLVLKFPSGWLKSHTLAKMELKQEAKRLKAAGFRLKYSD